MTVFEEKYKRLNAKQKEAVDTIEGPVMVIAGPGTGKTTILTLRIANILQKTDTPASGILAITFTEAGAKAMRIKLREVIGSRADEVRIHTFHGFAAAVISEFSDHFPHLARRKQITDIEAEDMIRQILTDNAFMKLRPAGDPEYYVGKIIHTITEAKKEAWTPEMLADFAAKEIERIQNDEDSISTRGATKGKLKADALKRIERCEKTMLFAKVYEAYEAKKQAERKMDFDDLIIELLVALRNDEVLLRLIQEKFLYMHIDEHQDTNDSQNFLIRLIADFFENPNLFIVGDEKQAIYRFQGASVENFLRFENAWPTMKVISLEDNYRSHQSILDAGFSLIENNYGEGEHERLRIKLKAGNKESPTPIRLVTAPNINTADEYLVNSIKELARTPDTVAIITRTNRDLERVLTLLEANDIEVSSERGVDIFTHPAGIAAFALIEFFADPSKVELLGTTLVYGMWNKKFEEIPALLRKIRSGSHDEVIAAIPEIAKLIQRTSEDGAIGALIEIATVSGFADIVAKDPIATEVWRGIVALSQDIVRNNDMKDPKALFESLLAYKISAESRSIKMRTGTTGYRIQAMTAHGSKGLEFDHVFIPYASEESWMSKPRSSSFVMPKERDEGDTIKDTRRLFYVALTRAKKNVAIIFPGTDTLAEPLTPVRFISELDAAHVAETILPDSNTSVTAKPYARKSSDEKLITHAKEVLQEKGLSVTALNHFLECPRLFLYKSILKLPEPPAMSSEKGTAMHEAIARVFTLSDKNVKNIAEAMEETIRTYFTKSFLKAFEKENAIQELVTAIPKVAAALETHFQTVGKVIVESWSDRPFTTQVANESVTIPIHGKIDAIIDTGSEALVFDYKTREAMSEAAIKGETKDSSGDYFRQLVFYDLLLSANSNYKGKAIHPALVFVKPDAKGRCPIISLPITDADRAAVESQIRSLVESVWTGKFLEGKCENAACHWCGMRRFGKF